MSTPIHVPGPTGSADAAGRKPLVPRGAVPIVDRLIGARPAQVVELRSDTPTIRVLELEPPVGFRHEAGQYVLLRLDTEDGPDLRPLSIASPPGAATIRLATRVGPSAFKRGYELLRPGETVKISRPMGRFRLVPGAPAVMLVGGIGITPVRSLLLDALASGRQDPVRLVFSNRHPDDVPFESELLDLARSSLDLQITWVFSEPNRGEPSRASVPAIDERLIAAFVDELPSARFYLTGPTPMVEAMRSVVRRAGVRRRRVLTSEQTLPVDRLTRRNP